MVEIAPATVVAAKDGSDDSTFMPDDKAQAGVAGEICLNAFLRVRFVQADAFGALLEGEHLVVVARGHFGEFEFPEKPQTNRYIRIRST
jgi:hypothetical protein